MKSVAGSSLRRTAASLDVAAAAPTHAAKTVQVTYETLKVGDLNIAYREAGQAIESEAGAVARLPSLLTSVSQLDPGTRQTNFMSSPPTILGLV